MNDRKKKAIANLQWTNVKVEAVSGRKILRGVSGLAESGQVLALMGASGGGKTTLLNALIQRNLRGLKCEGNILVNGRKIGKNIADISAYVQQDSLFIGSLTVKEHLAIHARLLMSNSTSEERSARVQEILADLGLKSCENSLIGVPGVKKGISGGEMRRLALATILFNDPAIIFCDEPTTGLDSFMAKKTIIAMEDLACNHQKTIICTIHQPSSELFELFDKVIFLIYGRDAFYGTPSEAVYYLNSIGYRIPLHVNFAEFFIETLALDSHNQSAKELKSLQVCNEFHMSQFNSYLHKSMIRTRCGEFVYGCNRGSYTQIFIALCIRNFSTLWRNKNFLWAKFLQKLFFGLFVAFLYHDTPLNQAGLQSLRGVLYFFVTDLTYSTILGVIATLPSDFPLLFRDYHNGYYPVSLYMITKVLSLLPIYISDSFLVVGISYFSIGLAPEIEKFVLALITCILVQQHVISLGVAVSCICSSVVVAFTVITPILTALSITGGLFSDVSYLPSYVSWIQYVSWFRYGYESLMINDFTHETRSNFSCHLSSTDTLATSFACTHSGLQAIEEEGFDTKNMFINWVLMIVCSAVNYAVAYIALVFRTIVHR